MTLLVLDIGSSSVRALLFDDSARLIDGAITSRKHKFLTDRAGRATANAHELRALVEGCLDEITSHPAAKSIRAVGMATFAGNWLGVDASGAPLTPVFTYADTASRSEIPRLAGALSDEAERYHQTSGCRLHPAYLPPQYARFERESPTVAARIERVVDFGAWLYGQFFGRPAPMSLSIASWTGLLDTARRQWHKGYARRLAGEGLAHKLPPLADFDAAQVGLSQAYARRWSTLRGCPFYLAVGDGGAANVGSGAVDSRHIALTVGTTSALRVVKAVERVPAGLWRYLVTADMPLVGGAASEGGNVYQWAVEELGLREAALEAELRRREPDGHGLTVLPLLAGERAPGWQPDASGTIHGLRLGSSRLDIWQAGLEAVALRLSLIMDMLSTEGVVMAGGGALVRSGAWARIIADAFDRPLRLLAESEVTARGVALMLRRSLDRVALGADPPRVAALIEPTPSRVRKLRAARERQSELYRRLYA